MKHATRRGMHMRNDRTNLASPALHLLEGEGPELPAQLLGDLILSSHIIEAHCRGLLKGHLLVVVHAPASAIPGTHLNACSLQFPLLLQRCQPACLFQLLLSCLPLGLLTPADSMSLRYLYADDALLLLPQAPSHPFPQQVIAATGSGAS